MNLNQKSYFAFALLAVALTCAAIGDMPAFAQQDAVKSSTQKWRPKNGVYGEPGKNFDNQCVESIGYLIELDEKRISGNEWGCDVTKLVDIGSSAIKLNMTCDNYNLAGDLKLPESTRFKEILLLRKIDEGTIFARQSTNGKFAADSGGRLAYCPEGAQRTYRKQREEDRAKARGGRASPAEEPPANPLWGK